MNDFERYIRAMEGELSVARQNLDVYKQERSGFQKKFATEFPRYKQVLDACDKWQREVESLMRQVNRARQMVTPTAAPEPEPVKKPEVREPPHLSAPADEIAALVDLSKEEVPAKPSQPFPSALSAGVPRFDRAGILRKLLNWNTSFPLAACYAAASKLEEQAIKAAIRDHPEYKLWSRMPGGISVTDSRTGIKTADLEAIAEHFGINVAAVRAEARAVHHDVRAFGEFEVDRMW